MSFINEYGWLIIFGLIIVFTALTMLFYSKKDIYDPEPPRRLIWGFILGIFSVIPALILSIIGVLIIGDSPLLTAIIVAPVMEETAKLLMVVWLSKSEQFDGPLDGLIYGAMVGAGFAAAENLLYGFDAVIYGGLVSGIALTTFRSVIQAIGHPLYTGLAGVGVGEWKVGLQNSKYNKIWRSMIFHGLWNLAASLVLPITFYALILVAAVNILFLRKELQRTLALDKDAYERGYYEQKYKLQEMRAQGMTPQVQPRWQMQSATTNWQRPPTFNTPNFDQGVPQFETQVIPTMNQPDQENSLPNFCKFCGTPRKEGDRFCRNCGSQIVQ